MQNKRITQKSLGFIFIIISAIAFGAMPIFARLAYEAKADPITVLFLRFGIAALVMFVIVFASKTAFPRGLLLLELILLGAIAYVGESLAYFTALTVASPGLVAVKRSGSIGSTTIIIASTAGVYAIIAPLHGMTLPVNIQGWIAILATALISAVLAFVTFFAGLKRIGPTTASTLSSFEPMVAVALAAIVLGETITPVQALGGALILAAVVILSRNEMRRSRQTRTQ